MQENINLLKKESSEKERSLKQILNEVNGVQSENGKLKKELKDIQEKYEIFETTVRSKLAETIQVLNFFFYYKIFFNLVKRRE